MTKQTLMIIDYGSGNLRSAQKAFEYVVAQGGLDAEVIVSAQPEDVAGADRIVLPGQGAFGDCIANLRGRSGMIAALEEAVLKQAKPFLGICVGMQILADQGLEHGTHEGLGWVPGQVVPLAGKISDRALKIPHMGWNEVEPVLQAGQAPHFVLRSAESSGQDLEHYYFVHSFMFESKNTDHVLGVTQYGTKYASVVGRDNIIGVQFHPEKSQKAGLNLLQQFLRWAP